VLFVNPASGGGKALRAALADHATERGISVTVLEPDRSLASLVRAAVADGADALGIAGGDGSLAIVAATARAHGLPFVCVPAGTRNHFALDLGVDRHDLLGALEAFIDGVERLIDLGSVNGRLFLNNVSLGVYGEAVRQSTYRDAKARTLLETAREVLGPSAAAPELRVVDNLGHEHRHPAVVLVSNNPYALDRPMAPGTRPRLDSGRLGVVVIDAPGSSPLPGRAWTATSVVVHGPAPVHAGIDGEAVELGTPLEFEILPAALRVRISARHPGVSPSGVRP
jgi:diacylglycerol kinase family enzyme